MAKVIGFGDLLVRFSPPGYQRFMQATSFEINYTGAEANVLVNLGLNDVETEFVTRLPDNIISQCALSQLKKYGVGTKHIVFGGDRIGTYYLEKGASQRPSRLVYDRKYTGMATAKPDDFDWDSIFTGATHFLFTGITPPLGDYLTAICMEACQEARRRGITIVCDLNYRTLLWDLETAQRTMREFMPFVDILVCGREDSQKLLDVTLNTVSTADDRIDRNAYCAVAEELVRRYGFQYVAITLRESISASDNCWSGMLYTDGKAYYSNKFSIHLVDRVGGGDAFTAGLLYALIHQYDPQWTIEFAVAAGCLKQTIEQDFNLSYAREIQQLAYGDTSGRIQR
ncbi:MAG: sugar kinase [Clostridiaceae bacterium]